MKTFMAKFQLGKQGLTQQFIDSISLAFKNRKQVRISVLKSCTRDKTKVIEIAEKIKEKLALKTRYRIIGFTLIFIKQ